MNLRICLAVLSVTFLPTTPRAADVNIPTPEQFEQLFLQSGSRTMIEFQDVLKKWGFPHEYTRIENVVCSDTSSLTVDETHTEKDGTRKQLVRYFDSNKRLFASYFVPNLGSKHRLMFRYLRADENMHPVSEGTMMLNFTNNRSEIAQAMVAKMLGQPPTGCKPTEQS